MTLPVVSRAAVFSEPDEPFELHEYRIPKLQPGEVLVEVLLSTICGSDLHTYHGRRSVPVPTILGHEIVGRLVWPEAVTDGAGRPVRAGERLVWSLTLSCRRCIFCCSGIPQRCESLRKFGHELYYPEWPLNGGLADYCILPGGTFYVGVPEHVPDTLAAPAGCATATIAGAVGAAGDLKGRRVLVMGAGVLGLTACAMLDAAGAGTIVVADTDTARASRASEFGATHQLDARLPTTDFVQSVHDATDGYGVDVVLEVAGANDAVERAAGSLRAGGQCLLIGSVFPQSPLPVSVEDIVRRMLTLRGVYNYAPEDLLRAMRFLSGDAGRYPLEDLVETSFPLQEVDEAFQFAGDGPHYRIAVAPGADRDGRR